jgi:hypothetical protein
MLLMVSLSFPVRWDLLASAQQLPLQSPGFHSFHKKLGPKVEVPFCRVELNLLNGFFPGMEIPSQLSSIERLARLLRSFCFLALRRCKGSPWPSASSHWSEL